MALPKFTIFIKDTDFDLRIAPGTDYRRRPVDEYTAQIRWTFLHLYCRRSWHGFNNPISSAEAVLPLIYAHPDDFRITEANELEVIDERTSA